MYVLLVSTNFLGAMRALVSFTVLNCKFQILTYLGMLKVFQVYRFLIFISLYVFVGCLKSFSPCPIGRLSVS